MDNFAAEVYELISAVSDQSNTQQQELNAKLESYTYQIENVQIFENLLPNCTESKSNLYMCMLLIKNTFVNRGVLLNYEEIPGHLSFFFNFAQDYLSIICSDPTILNIFSDTTAIIIRTLYDQTHQYQYDQFSPVFSFYGQSDDHKRISYSAMSSFLATLQHRFKTPPSEYDLMKRSFFQNIFPTFMKVAFEGINSQSSNIIEISLPFLENCFEIMTVNKINKDMSTFYEQSDALYQIGTPLSYQVLFMYYQSMNKTMKIKEKICRNLLTKLPDIISRINSIDDPSIYSITHLLLLFSDFSFQALLMKHSQDVQFFFDSVCAFSLNVLKNIEEFDSFENLWKFWSFIAIEAINIPEELSDYFPTLIKTYVDMIFELIDSSYERVEELLFEDFDKTIKNQQPMYGIFGVSGIVATNYIIELVTQILEEPVLHHEDLTKLSVIILLVTSIISKITKINTKSMDDHTRSMAMLIIKVFNIINATNPMVAALFNDDNELVMNFERLLMKFGSVFKTNYLSTYGKGAPISTKKIQMVLDQNDYNFNQSFNIIVDRFIMDLEIFSTYPQFLYEILCFIDDLSNHNAQRADCFQGAAKDNQSIQRLINREININILSNDLEPLIHLYPKLTIVYARNIATQDRWPEFLEYFDEKFESTPINDSLEVFKLFLQVYGIFMSIRCNDHYYLLVRWILDFHVNHIIAYIRANLGQEEVIEAISNAWVAICPYGTEYQLRFEKGRSEGIEVFRASELIVTAILESSENIQWYALQIINSCFIGKFANFGIMNYYKDPSYPTMIQHFFHSLENWSLGESSDRLLMTLKSLNTLADIDIDAILSKKERLYTINECLIQSLLMLSPDIWVVCCHILTKIMSYTISISAEIRPYLQFIIVILDGIINLPDKLPSIFMASSDPLCLYTANDFEAISHMIQEIVNSFEVKYQTQVQEIMLSFFNKLVPNDLPQEELNVSFSYLLNSFWESMQKFQIRLSSLPVFAPIFTRE